MRNRLDGDQALDIAKQVVAENPGISQEEMNEKAEALARMVRENSPPAEMPISRAGPSAEPESDFMTRMRESPMGQRTTKQIELIRDALDAAERRQTPGTSVTMDYTMGQSQQLAKLRSDPAFGVGFRQGINDYEKMKSESPDTIIDDLSGSIDEANMARESLFRGNVDPRDLKRLGYAEAMEYADREEKNIEEKALRQGMMDR